MSNDEFSCISDLGAILQLFGGVLVIISQVFTILTYITTLNNLHLYPPDEIPFVQFLLSLIGINIFAAILFGTFILIGGTIAIRRSGPIGGLLSIIFAIPSFIPIGQLFWIGPILTIIGGIMSIVPSVKPPPKPKKKSKVN